VTDTGGSLLASRPKRPVLCGSWSPHEAGTVRRGREAIPVPVQCNLPHGHDGNHMNLLPSFEKLAEWGQSEVYK
jgi:hypothetical protein